MYSEENEEYYENNNETLPPNGNVDMTMKLPAKSHINKLEGMIQSLQYDLEESKKDIQKLRGEFLYLGFQNNDNNSFMSKFIVEEAIKLTNDFRKRLEESNEDANQTKQQIAALSQERIKIQEDVLVLENRIFESEKDLGYTTDI